MARNTTAASGLANQADSPSTVNLSWGINPTAQNCRYAWLVYPYLKSLRSVFIGRGAAIPTRATPDPHMSVVPVDVGIENR